MTQRRPFLRSLCFTVFVFLGLSCYPAYAGGTGTFSPGMALPGLTLAGSASQKDQKYLGLSGSEAFSLSQISGKMVCVEILSVL
jgi:hypothetical protein